MIIETDSSKLPDFVGKYIIVVNQDFENYGVRILEMKDSSSGIFEGITGDRKGRKFSFEIPDQVKIKVYDEDSLIDLLMEIKER